MAPLWLTTKPGKNGATGRGEDFHGGDPYELMDDLAADLCFFYPRRGQTTLGGYRKGGLGNCKEAEKKGITAERKGGGKNFV